MSNLYNASSHNDGNTHHSLFSRVLKQEFLRQYFLKPFRCFHILPLLLLSIVSFNLTGCWEIRVVERKEVEQAKFDTASFRLLKAEQEAKEIVDSVNKSEKETDKGVTSNLTDSESTTASIKNVDSFSVNKQHADVLDFSKNLDQSLIQYNTEAWDNGNGDTKIGSLNVNKVGKISEKFGKVFSTDEKIVDFANHPAIKYRYMQKNKPYFDIVDSVDYLELDWYYANPDDTESEKLASLNHAKKAYQMSSQIMGTEGGALVSQMLSGQTINNKTINDTVVVLGKCEFYECMLVLKKSIFADIDAEYDKAVQAIENSKKSPEETQ